jgi:phosphate transport system protein
MRHIQEMLDELRAKLLTMSTLVESAIKESAHALSGDPDVNIQDIFKRERQVNRLELEIDEIATGILALEQPVAGDLRFVTAAAKINNNLERIGDLAAGIARRAESLAQVSRDNLAGEIPTLAELVADMVNRALRAFVNNDAQEARAVLASDDAVDHLHESIFTELVENMKRDAQVVQTCVDLMLAARNLERIADHATNIAEAVVFISEGVDVRHRSLGVEI